MDVIGIDHKTIERAARVLRNRQEELERLDLFDARFYPRSESEEEILRYFIVMVAMDHRLSRPGRPYSACIENECYKGADLLYRLGSKVFHEEPEFFNPVRLAQIRVDDVIRVFSIGDASPPDPEVRTLLLRDLGYKLMKLYDGSVKKLLDLSNNRVRGSITQPGLVDHLRVFRAYEDPVEKKSMLLAKFLIGRGLFKPIDEIDVAVDNHLSRIAYRLGLVLVSGPLWEKIRKGLEVTSEDDTMLRLAIRRAYRLVAVKAGLKPSLVDDYFWLMGRKTCLRDEPPSCDRCLFKGFCMARRNNAFMVSEHLYYDTWFY